MKYMYLSVLLTTFCFTQVEAVKYAVQVSGTSFETTAREEGEFTPFLEGYEIPDAAIPLDNETFLEVFKTFCLNQISHQFSAPFYKAIGGNGVTYQDFITQQETVAQHLVALAQLTIEGGDIPEIKSPEESIPAVCFFKKNKTEKFNLSMVWHNAAPHPIEFMVRVKVEEAD